MAGAVIAARGNMRQSKSQKDLNTALEGEVLILRRRLAWLPCHAMLALMRRAAFDSLRPCTHRWAFSTILGAPCLVTGRLTAHPLAPSRLTHASLQSGTAVRADSCAR